MSEFNWRHFEGDLTPPSKLPASTPLCQPKWLDSTFLVLKSAFTVEEEFFSPKGYGLANVELNVPVKPNLGQLISSLSRQRS
jgi:hypothetical protein